MVKYTSCISLLVLMVLMVCVGIVTAEDTNVLLLRLSLTQNNDKSAFAQLFTTIYTAATGTGPAKCKIITGNEATSFWFSVEPEITPIPSGMSFTFPGDPTTLDVAIYFSPTATCDVPQLQAVLDTMLPTFATKITVDYSSVVLLTQPKSTVGSDCQKHSECITNNCVDKPVEEIKVNTLTDDITSTKQCSEISKFEQADQNTAVMITTTLAMVIMLSTMLF